MKVFEYLKQFDRTHDRSLDDLWKKVMQLRVDFKAKKEDIDNIGRTSDRHLLQLKDGYNDDFIRIKSSLEAIEYRFHEKALNLHKQIYNLFGNLLDNLPDKLKHSKNNKLRSDVDKEYLFPIAVSLQGIRQDIDVLHENTNIHHIERILNSSNTIEEKSKEFKGALNRNWDLWRNNQNQSPGDLKAYCDNLVKLVADFKQAFSQERVTERKVH